MRTTNFELNGFEELTDLQDKFCDAMDRIEIDGEYQGNIIVTLEYIPEGTSERIINYSRARNANHKK